MSNISLASSTASRVDSAAKHIVVARCCTDFYAQFLRGASILQEKKNEYMIKRDEICLGIGRPFNTDKGFSHADNKAYIPVITNVAVLDKGAPTDEDSMSVKDYYAQLYDCRTLDDVADHVGKPCRVANQPYYPSELFFSGIALTQAFAHPHSGDTALSTMIGGLKTIRNGRFPVYANDQVMWYFEFESENFLQDGSRKPTRNIGDRERNQVDASIVDKDVMLKRKRDHEYAEIAQVKKLVYPKPFLPGVKGNGVSIMDKRRVFGIALGYASPYDLVDIMICRQSV